MTALEESVKSRYLDIVKKHINVDDEKLNEFCSLLKENNAIIAGGSVSKAVYNGNWYVEDLDIYVNIKNSIPIRNFIINLPLSIFSIETKGRDNLYCNSFLKMNRIYKVVRFNFLNEKHIDLMYVYNSRSLLDVVNNFDLTCCQSWFNGQDIFTSHPETIETKKCYMNKDYVKSLISGNLFTKNRLRKYIDRGFSFTIPTHDVDLSNLDNHKYIKNINYKENIKKIVFNCVFGIDKYFDKNIFNFAFENFEHSSRSLSSIQYNELLEDNYEVLEENYEDFIDDGYDWEELNSFEDYDKIGEKEEAEKVVNFLKKILDNFNEEYFFSEESYILNYIPQKIAEEYKKALYEIFNLKENKEDEIFVNKYPEFKEMCYDTISMTEMEAGEFLSRNPTQNILIKCEEKLLAFRRKELIRFCNERVTTLNEGTIYFTYTYMRHYILHDDVKKFSIPSINLFILKNNDIIIDDENIYIIEPISVKKYLSSE